MKKHMWTTMAIVFAVLIFGSGIQPLSRNLLAGAVMLLSALACRSANKRRLQEVTTNITRVTIEFSLIFIMILLVILQNDLADLIRVYPVTNLIIPVFCLAFYVSAFFKARSSGRLPKG